MLDDLKVIHERDPQDALGVAEKQWQQLGHSFDDIALGPVQADNIVYAGMGGSALGALLSLTWPGHNLPFEICRNYDIPRYVSNKTLFIASSYSGNTEETLSALEAAGAKGAHIAVIASGGKLADVARAKGYPLALLPASNQPRYAVFSNLKASLTVLQKAGLLSDPTIMQQLDAAAEYIHQASQAWLPTVPASQNQAKQIAQELMGRSVVIYAGPLLFPAAYKWKISCNESAKNVAWCNQYPEFNHNEFMGWSSHPVDKPYAVVDLRSKFEHPRIQKRFVVTERMLSGKRPAPIVVDVQGENLLQHLLWAVTLGDFVSLYLAILNGVNPTPVALIEDFKKALDQ